MADTDCYECLALTEFDTAAAWERLEGKAPTTKDELNEVTEWAQESLRQGNGTACQTHR